MKRQYFNGNCFKYFFKNPKFKTIVFIHGLGLNQDVWSWQVSLFKNHNVLTYDLLGHGDSKDPEGEISLSLFADQLLQIISHIKLEKIILIDVPSKVYPELRKIFIFVFENSGFKDIKISNNVDFENLYNLKKSQ